MDAYYTPTAVANKTLSQVRGRPTSVADFTAGDGVLLRAAADRWPQAEIIATDIDYTTVRLLRKAHPRWHVGRCDFLSASSRALSGALRDRSGGVSLILLNPPFSGRGGTRASVCVGGEVRSCSKPLAILAASIEYVRPNGEIVAILPASTWDSDKDRDMWRWLRCMCTIQLCSRLLPYAFPECSAAAVIVWLKVRRRDRSSVNNQCKDLRALDYTATSRRLVRGLYPMHEQPRRVGGVRVIHTTNIRNGTVLPSHRYASSEWRQVRGPAVLLPRVGMPDRNKIAIYLDKSPRVLSDCVIAIACSSASEARDVHAILLSQWRRVRRIYTGTCAKYTTLRRVRELMSRLEIKNGSSDESNEPRTWRRIG